MSDRLTNILLIDDDSIFRLGLCTALSAFPLQIIPADSDTAAFEVLASEQAVDLVILELNINRQLNYLTGLTLCQQLKTTYANLPILLLTFETEPARLSAAQKYGVEGYCPKGVAVDQLLEAIAQLLAGQSYWHSNLSSGAINTVRPPRWQQQMRSQGLRQIEAALLEVNQRQNPESSTFDWLYWSGRRRELLAARWLVNQLLPTDVIVVEVNRPQPKLDNRFLTVQSPQSVRQITSSKIQSTPFQLTLEKINSGLANLSGVVLEIDILQRSKKQDLLIVVLNKFKNILEELHFSQVTLEQLSQKRGQILQDLWQLAISDFFGKYYTLPVGEQQLSVVEILLENAAIVQETILEKIPLVFELLAHQLFETALMIDNVAYPAKTPEAQARAEMILQNLIIQVANAVIGQLLNEFADLEAIKQNFYDLSLISTREIARFRNNLSWRYRVSKLILEPRAIFESRYDLLVLSDTGIKQISIYAPRRQELEQLQGLGLLVTLAYETQDAIAPRMRSLVAWVGRGVVYVLTQVLGRSIGLVVRGVIQGIGSSLQETRFGKNSQRGKSGNGRK